MTLPTSRYVKILRTMSNEISEALKKEEVPLPYNIRLAHANIISAYQLVIEHRKEIEGKNIPTV